MLRKATMLVLAAGVAWGVPASANVPATSGDDTDSAQIRLPDAQSPGDEVTSGDEYRINGEDERLAGIPENEPILDDSMDVARADELAMTLGNEESAKQSEPAETPRQ